MATKLEALAEAKAAYEKLQAEAADEIKANKKVVIGEVIEHMQENGITLAEISAMMALSKSKYSNATGDTWSGKGKKPSWIEKHLAAGGKLEDVLTNKA